MLGLHFWDSSRKRVVLTDQIYKIRFNLKTRSEIHASPKLIEAQPKNKYQKDTELASS